MSQQASSRISLNFDELPEDAYVRQAGLIAGQKNSVPVLPFSHATLWRRVKEGSFPRPAKLGGRITAWRVGDVRNWLKQQGVTA